MAILLLFVPATLVAPYLHLSPVVQFFLSVIAVIPLAGFVGASTEALTARLGSRAGGLFNATFGNAPDLLVGIIGVQKGLIVLVKATLIGALISNSALIMGVCFIVAGLKYGRPTFNRREAGHHSVLMMLTVAAVLFPSVGAFVTCGIRTPCAGAQQGPINSISLGIAIVLLFAYACYLLFGVFGLERIRRGGRGASPAPAESHTPKATLPVHTWPVWVSVLVLAVATVLLIPVINVLTDSVGSFTSFLGISEVFVGMVIVGNAGNAAEAYSAIRLSLLKPGTPIPGHPTETGLDMAIGIASASSIQIAAFVAPLIVIIGLFAHPFNLVFSAIEIAILGLLVLVFEQTAFDGEANWLEGAQLIALYAMAAVVFYLLPATAF